jgi:hypothetical protein
MTAVVPIISVPSQKMTVTLGGQQCQLAIDQKYGLVFVSISIGGVAVVAFSLARDRVPLVRYPYLGFKGTLAFIDTQGTSDPDYSGFGTRWKLVYLP